MGRGNGGETDAYATSLPSPLSIGWRGGTGVRSRRTQPLSLAPSPSDGAGEGGEVWQLASQFLVPKIRPRFRFRLCRPGFNPFSAVRVFCFFWRGSPPLLSSRPF